MDIDGYNDDEIDICLTIWGCVPYDYKWAKETEVYKKEVEERERRSRELWINAGIKIITIMAAIIAHDMFYASQRQKIKY